MVHGAGRAADRADDVRAGRGRRRPLGEVDQKVAQLVDQGVDQTRRLVPPQVGSGLLQVVQRREGLCAGGGAGARRDVDPGRRTVHGPTLGRIRSRVRPSSPGE
ncbi:MAG: hypothetical protein DCC50_03860 [Acidobacteria bacterium]|nr:MAG: hypothetical protein DCC50_03860 [Acidobacteriota bacterium]